MFLPFPFTLYWTLCKRITIMFFASFAINVMSPFHWVHLQWIWNIHSREKKKKQNRKKKEVLTFVALNVYNNSIKTFILSLTKTWIVRSKNNNKINHEKHVNPKSCSVFYPLIFFRFSFSSWIEFIIWSAFQPSIHSLQVVPMLNSAIYINIHEIVWGKKGKKIIHGIHSQIQVGFDSKTKAEKKIKWISNGNTFFMLQHHAIGRMRCAHFEFWVAS